MLITSSDHHQAHASVARASCEIIKLIQVDEEDIQRNLHQNMNLQPTTRGRGVHPRGRGIQSSRGLNVSRPTRGNINVPRGSRGGQNQRGARGVYDVISRAFSRSAMMNL